MQLGTLSSGTWINSYDDNGNILKMKQYGLKVTSSSVIDDLTYTYNIRSNKLKNVIDANNETTTVLGDFRSSAAYMTALGGTKTSSAVDYDYDLNGNLKKDLNKDINDASVQAIQYNYLNLPWKILVKDKGVIKYVYDADGNKLEKMTNDNTTPPVGQPNRSKSTIYLDGFTYENNELKFMSHEEGQVRIKITSGQANGFSYDYFLKDNLGNIRVILTDETTQDTYPVATLEDGATGVESQYYNIQTGNIVSKTSITNFNNTTTYYNNNGNPPYNTNPTSNTTAANTKLYKLNGSDGNHSGLGITLKVMTGDEIDIFAKSYYHTNGTINNSYPLTSVLTSFINAFAGTSAVVGAGKGVTGTMLNSSSGTTTGLTDWLQNNVPTPNDRPKAYINWILFDEQFRPVMSNSGFDAVSANSDELKPHHNTVSITKSGYLYVYCSNESNQNVFFDNLQVIHTRGPLLETNEYYPFGLLASGISYKGAGLIENNHKFSSNELQDGEFAGETGLEFYDFNTRIYDAQIGRFMAIDPFSDLDRNQTPYGYVRNNPIAYTDALGLSPESETMEIDPGREMTMAEYRDFEDRVYDYLWNLLEKHVYYRDDDRFDDDGGADDQDPNVRYYESKDDAALGWSRNFGIQSMWNGREYGSSIYSIMIKGKRYYAYNLPNVGPESKGGNYTVEWNKVIPKGAELEGVIHSHVTKANGGSQFSNFKGRPELGAKGDVQVMNDDNGGQETMVDWYLAAPDGTLKRANSDFYGSHTLGLTIVKGLVDADMVKKAKDSSQPMPKNNPGDANVKYTDLWQGKNNGVPIVVK
jgi:RHS repeat-associated protein